MKRAPIISNRRPVFLTFSRVLSMASSTTVWSPAVSTVPSGLIEKGSCALHAALDAGAPVDVPVESVAADSLGAKRCGDLVHRICASRVSESVLVGDDAILEAQARLWNEMQVAAEPGGATALARRRRRSCS